MVRPNGSASGCGAASARLNTELVNTFILAAFSSWDSDGDGRPRPALASFGVLVRVLLGNTREWLKPYGIGRPKSGYRRIGAPSACASRTALPLRCRPSTCESR